jgi:hypothetical protein
MLTIQDGSLGLGTVFLFNAKNKKSYLTKEVYLNAWSSGQTLRSFNKIPKKYQALIDQN